MSLKGKIEAIIYAAEEPVTVEQMAVLLKDQVLAELANDASNAALEATSEDGAPVESDGATEGNTQPPSGSTADGATEGNTQPPKDGATEGNTQPPKDGATGGNTQAPGGATADGTEGNTQPPNNASGTEGNTQPPHGKKKVKDPEMVAVRAHLRKLLEELVIDYENDVRGIEIRQIAGGYRMATKPEHHDVVVNFAKSLKPPIRLSLQALETLACIAYKQPVTAPEVSEIRGVDSSGVISTLLDRKLVTTAGRKQVIGRPILYKTTKEFLMRFGLKDVNELPSMEEFEKLGDAGQGVMFESEGAPEPQASGDETARTDDAMMAREDEMVAQEDAAVAGAADAPITDNQPAHGETQSESAADTSEVQGSTIENS
jgi:segregation and condensation protein B